MKKICIIAFLVNIIFIQCYGEDFPALFFKEIEAQNFIGGQNIFRYWPGNLVDKDLSTAWAYSRAGTDNLFYTRAIVSFSFLNTNWIDEIRIWNGYGKSSDLWKKNNRAREISIFIGISGTKSFTNIEYVLKDTDGYQSIKFSPVLGNEVNVQILSTYPGTMYDDTCISEIEFWYQGQKYEVANLEEAKREFVRKRKERVLKILLGGPERREGYSFNWMFGLSYITFTRTGKERGEFFIQACIDSRGAFVTNMKQAPDGSEMIITNIRGEWRFDEEGIFWTRVKGKDWKATDVSYIGENDLGRQGAVYFRGSDIETCYFNWSGPDADAGP